MENHFPSHLFREHCDVVEVSLTSLFHGQSEEKPAPVLGEQRLLSLQGRTQFTHECLCVCTRCFSYGTYTALRKVPLEMQGVYGEVVCKSQKARFTCLESHVSDESSCF